MNRQRQLPSLLTLLLLAPACVPPAVDIEAILIEVDQLSLIDLWPDFDPGLYPVAIYNGSHTYLFRHPSPPAEFEPAGTVDRPGGMWVYRGLHGSVRANSAIEIGGTVTATVMLDPDDYPGPEATAALIGHELFHIHQAVHLAHWSANEAVLFTFPIANPEQLGLRRLESEALRRAFAAITDRKSACWTAAALQFRRQRFRALSEGQWQYERKNELKEGVAQYIQNRASPAPDESIPKDGFAPGEIRNRGYATGNVMSFLLDRLRPGWRAEISADTALTLDSLLTLSLGDLPRVCEFKDNLVRDIRATAESDVRDLNRQRVNMLREFQDRAGWRIVMTASLPNWLWPGGFDPLNITALTRGRLLHKRWLQLSTADASVEILDRSSLTIPVGEHPMFNGIQEVIVTGIEARPEPDMDNDTLRVTLEGIIIRAVGAQWKMEGQTLTIQLP